MRVEQGKISRRGADAVLDPSPEADPSPPPQPPHSFQGEHGRVKLTLSSGVSFPLPFPTCRFKTHQDSNVPLEGRRVNICNLHLLERHEDTSCMSVSARQGRNNHLPLFKTLISRFLFKPSQKTPSSLVWLPKPQHRNAHKHYEPQISPLLLPSC